MEKQLPRDVVAEKIYRLLKVKLLQFQQQNSENIKVSKNEINKLREEAEEVEKINVSFIKQLEDEKTKLQLLMSKHIKSTKTNDKSKILAKEFRNTKLINKLFKLLVHNVLFLRGIQGIRTNKVKRMKLQVLISFKKYMMVNKFIRQRDEQKDYNLYFKTFRGLTFNIEWMNKLRRLKQLQNNNMIKRTLYKLKKYPKLKAKHKKYLVTAETYYICSLKCKSLRGLKGNLIKTHSNNAISCQVLIQKAFKGLKFNAHESILERRIEESNITKAVVHFSSILKKKTLNGFRKLRNRYNTRRLNDYISMKAYNTANKCMIALKKNVELQYKAKLLLYRQLKMKVKKFMVHWVRLYKIMEYNNQIEVVTDNHFKELMFNKTYKGLIIYLKEKKRNKRKSNRARNHYIKKLKVNSLYYLHKLMNINNLSQRHIRESVYTYFNLWKDHYWKSKLIKLKNHFALSFKKQKAISKLKKLLRKWLIITKQQRLIKPFKANYKVPSMFSLWIQKTLLSLKNKLNIASDFKGMKEKSEHLEETLNKLEEECKSYEGDCKELIKKRQIEEAEVAEKSNELFQREQDLIQVNKDYKNNKEAIFKYNTMIEQFNHKLQNLTITSVGLSNDTTITTLTAKKDSLMKLIEQEEEKLKEKQILLNNIEKELMSSTREVYRDNMEELSRIIAGNNKLVLILEDKTKSLNALNKSFKQALEHNIQLRLQVEMSKSSSTKLWEGENDEMLYYCE